jgi:parvulin-like peptidyl-prolyl isomerase
MPLVFRPQEAVLRRLSNVCFSCRQAFTPFTRSGSRIIVGLIFPLVFLLVGCRTVQPAVPVTDTVATAPPVEVSTPTVLPPSLATTTPPSSVETEGGPTQDGRPLAARVNGQPIFLDVYQKQVAQTERALVEQDLIVEGEEGQAQLAQVRQNVLNGLIEQAIIEQAAAAAGILVTDDELESAVQESIALGQGQESFDQWLAENDMTMEGFRETQRSQLIASKMIEHITALVPTNTEQVHARHIRTSDLAKAQSLLDELRAGANFAALAQQASEDVSTAANGGDLGWFPRDVPLMPPLVVEAAFALQAGEISDVIESDQGYHIIKVEAREANRPLTPEVLLYVRQRAFETWLAEQWGNAIIERYVDM